MPESKCKAAAWTMKKMSNHVIRLRKRAQNQRYDEIHALADSLLLVGPWQLFHVIKTSLFLVNMFVMFGDSGGLFTFSI